MKVGLTASSALLLLGRSLGLQVTQPSVKSSTASLSRRGLLQTMAFSTPMLITLPAGATTGAGDGLLPDLPPEAVRSYLQYRVQLQTSADFYIFELQKQLDDFSDWGEVGQLFNTAAARGGQGQPSRMEREFTNVFRIIGLSMPPDTADEMREAQFKFEKGIAILSKATAGIRRDLPVEMDKDAIPLAKSGWEEGRQGINMFFKVMNEVTGLSEMKMIPPAGQNQFSEYGRSERRYVDLKKKIKLCQNRGGPALCKCFHFPVSRCSQTKTMVVLAYHQLIF